MQYPAMPATKTTRGHVISLFPDMPSVIFSNQRGKSLLPFTAIARESSKNPGLVELLVCQISLRKWYMPKKEGKFVIV